MSTSNALILHVNRELLAAMPITKECSPVYGWDNATRTFSDTQATDDNNGLPLWETEALLKTGWRGDTTPVRLRIAAQSKPAVKPDPAKLVAALTGEPSLDSQRRAN